MVVRKLAKRKVPEVLQQKPFHQARFCVGFCYIIPSCPRKFALPSGMDFRPSYCFLRRWFSRVPRCRHRPMEKCGCM